MKRLQVSPLVATAIAAALPSFGAGTGAGSTPPRSAAGLPARRPNVILIITDQQQTVKASYLGTTGLSTPSIDRIATSGYSFTNAWSVYPLSVPSRVALFTGRYPSELGVRSNFPVSADLGAIQPSLLGFLFDNAGYDTWYGGKVHLPDNQGNQNSVYYGFSHTYIRDRGAELGRSAAKLIGDLARGDKPFFVVASFINPHDICGFDDMISRPRGKNVSDLLRGHNDQAQKIPRSEFYGPGAPLPASSSGPDTTSSGSSIPLVAPLLPGNFARMAGAPERLPWHQPAFSEEQWRLRRWIYNRLVEDVDSDLAPVVDAIQRNGLLNNTIVVFTSDHGDMDGAHGMELKGAPFNECQKIPFIFTGPGIAKKIDNATAVSNGIDLLPTLCDLVGIPIPEGLPGRSLKGLITGKTGKVAAPDRDLIFCEGGNWFQVIYKGRYKYTLVEAPGLPALLVDLQKDPGEMVNLAGNPAYAATRKMLSGLLAKELSRRGITPNPNNPMTTRQENRRDRE